MKLIPIVTLAALSISPLAQTVARADSVDEVLARVQALEKENAAIKKENEALRRGKHLREQNSALVRESASRSASALPVSRTVSQDPREAYAADMPIYSKAPAPVERGLLKLWAEGGATWSGGDPIYSFYNRFELEPLIAERPDFFALTPKLGWEAATGFDYRFSASPWHVSGQFRYGEARTSVSRAFAQSILIPAAVPFTVTSADNPSAKLKETHWLTDLALGRDVIGSGPDAMQFKL